MPLLCLVWLTVCLCSLRISQLLCVSVLPVHVHGHYPTFPFQHSIYSIPHLPTHFSTYLHLLLINFTGDPTLFSIILSCILKVLLIHVQSIPEHQLTNSSILQSTSFTFTPIAKLSYIFSLLSPSHLYTPHSQLIFTTSIYDCCTTYYIRCTGQVRILLFLKPLFYPLAHNFS